MRPAIGCVRSVPGQWDGRKGQGLKKRCANKGKKATGGARRDQQLVEFERRDLGDDIRASRSAVVLRGPSRPTSILLGQALIKKLRQKGAKRGFGYQTMLKMIVMEHLDEY